MDPQAKKKLIGALIAGALAIAVYYGLIDKKQADTIKTQADQALGTGPTTQQPAPAPPHASPPAPAPPAQPNSAPAQPQSEVRRVGGTRRPKDKVR